MANSTREWARRELERASNLCEWVGGHTARVEERYRPLHPEIADPCVQILQLVELAQKMLLEVRARI